MTSQMIPLPFPPFSEKLTVFSEDNVWLHGDQPVDSLIVVQQSDLYTKWKSTSETDEK